MGASEAENLLTREAHTKDGKSVSDQMLDGDRAGTRSAVPSLRVEHSNTARRRSEPTRGRPKRRAAGGGERKPKRRGPKGSTSLAWSQVKDIEELADVARAGGQPLNVMATISPPADLSDAAGKRVIARKIGHLGQALKRRGVEHIGVMVYEKNPDAPKLHAHHLCHVPRQHIDVIERFDNPPFVDVRRADREAIGYVTKQHKRLPPDYYARTDRRWIGSAHIDGPRVSMTAASKALLAETRERRAAARATSAPPLRPHHERPASPPPAPPTTAYSQPDLFGELPVAPRFDPIEIARTIRAHRERHQLTQAELGARLGIRQPHLANVERLHDRLSPARAKAALHLLEQIERIAA